MSEAPETDSVPRVRIDVLLRADPKREIEELVRGLSSSPPWVHPRWLYDDVGCALFEQICELPEYYQTRTEAKLLRDRADEIAKATDAASLVELGSGAATKSRILLKGLQRHGTLRLYGPLDVNEGMVRRVADEIVDEFERVNVHGVVANFTEPLPSLPGEGRRLVIFLGGTIGNFDRPGAKAFLERIHRMMNPGDCLLLGVDLIKERQRIIDAYDDAQGVSAAFSKNVLVAINRALGSNFNPAAFDHVALYDDENHWIEVRLRANRDVHVTASDHGFELKLDAGDDLLTEISTKYDEGIASRMLESAGFTLDRWMTDSDDLFGLALASRD